MEWLMQLNPELEWSSAIRQGLDLFIAQELRKHGYGITAESLRDITAPRVEIPKSNTSASGTPGTPARSVARRKRSVKKREHSG